jgi:prepilin-type N-terminal cleavage/methylation domain-containing protein
MRSGRGWMGEGHSLPELLAVLSIVGILVSIAVPRLNGYIMRARVRGAAQMLRGDLMHARMLATRSGHGAVVTFLREPDCADGDPRAGRAWRIDARGPSRAEIPASLRSLGGRVCYAWNGSDSMVFNSRGLLAPFNNRTLRVREGAVAESVSVSVAGRVLQRARQGKP